MAKVTEKYQIAIPKEVRNVLTVKPGEEVEWSIVKVMAFVSKKEKMNDPVKFLTSQVKKPINRDVIRLIHEIRENPRK